MTVNFNPGAVNRPVGGNIRRDSRRQAAQSERDEYAPPTQRAILNFIPAAESIQTLVESAVAALRRGVYWDRGTILNLLV